MKFPAYIALSAALLAGACGSVSGSKYNPMNWGRSSEGPATLAPEEGYVTIDTFRDLVAEVTTMSVVRTNGGVIVHATGLPQTQGYFEAELVALNDEKPLNGTLTYEFRVAPPLEQSRVSTEVSRDIVVAHVISNIKLRDVRQIKIVSATNSRSSRAR